MDKNPNLTKPKYSVIVLMYNRTPELVQLTRDCIASVKNSSKDYELVVVDNGSTEQYPWDEECDTYIRLNKNYGISRGWNVGLLAARGKFKVIIGNDILVREGWLEAMAEGMDKPFAGMVNPHVQHLPPGMGIVENYKWPSGACFMLSDETIKRVGYFDEDVFYPGNYEDISYWCKIYKAGLKIYRNYGMTVMHKEGSTVHAADISSHNEENKKRFIEMWGFDPIPIFFEDASIYEALNILN